MELFVPLISCVFLLENKNILNARVKYLRDFVCQKNGWIVLITLQ